MFLLSFCLFQFISILKAPKNSCYGLIPYSKLVVPLISTLKSLKGLLLHHRCYASANTSRNFNSQEPRKALATSYRVALDLVAHISTLKAPKDSSYVGPSKVSRLQRYISILKSPEGLLLRTGNINVDMLYVDGFQLSRARKDSCYWCFSDHGRYAVLISTLKSPERLLLRLSRNPTKQDNLAPYLREALCIVQLLMFLYMSLSL